MKEKSKNAKDRKEQRLDTSYSESVRTKLFFVHLS